MVSNSRYKIKRNFVALAAVVAACNTAGDFRKKRHFSSMSHDHDVMRRTSITDIVPDAEVSSCSRSIPDLKPSIAIHSSGANSHVVQISMLRPLQLMFIPIGWQKLFQAAITAANNAVATI